MVGHWLTVGSLKKKENTDQDHFHNNRETDGAASTSDTKDKLWKNKMITISIQDLHVLVYPLHVMHSVHHVRKL
jgi:hypothetical protein